MRVWIEIKEPEISEAVSQFHPLMRVWIEINVDLLILDDLGVSPSYEGVD